MEPFTDVGSGDVPGEDVPVPDAPGEWIDIRSQHAVKTPTRAIATFLTMCGRRAMGSPHGFDMTKKSCESCLRIVHNR